MFTRRVGSYTVAIPRTIQLPKPLPSKRLICIKLFSLSSLRGTTAKAAPIPPNFVLVDSITSTNYHQATPEVVEFDSEPVQILAENDGFSSSFGGPLEVVVLFPTRIYAWW